MRDSAKTPQSLPVVVSLRRPPCRRRDPGVTVAGKRHRRKSRYDIYEFSESEINRNGCESTREESGVTVSFEGGL